MSFPVKDHYRVFLDCEEIKEIYKIDLNPSELIYNESLHSWSWSASLTIFKKNNIFYCIEDDSDPFPVSENEALQKMLEFEEI